MKSGETIEDAHLSHDDWIDFYNLKRIHSSVINRDGIAHSPLFRFTWKPSLASPISDELDVDAVFSVNCIPSSNNTRKVNAQRQIRYRKQLYTFEQLNKGDVVSVKESKETLKFYYQEQLLVTDQAAKVRKVKASGCVEYQNQYYQLENLPKGTVVLITRVDGELHFSVNGELLLVAEGQTSVQQPI